MNIIDDINKFVSSRYKESADYFQSIAIDRQNECIRLESVIKSLQAKKNDQEFFDKAAISAMQSIINDPYTPLNNVDLSKHAAMAYIIANALLTERKRLQGVDNGTN